MIENHDERLNLKYLQMITKNKVQRSQNAIVIWETLVQVVN